MGPRSATAVAASSDADHLPTSGPSIVIASVMYGNRGAKATLALDRVIHKDQARTVARGDV
jgi:hypothetical protein